MTEREEIEELRAALEAISKILRETGAHSSAYTLPPKKSAIPCQQVVDLYHEILPFGSACRKLTGKRKAAIEARWKSGDLPDLETWREYFERAAKAKFIRGEVPPGIGHRQFTVSLDYLIREDSYAKALENTGAFKW